MLADAGLITEDDKSLIIDKSKVRRERKLQRTESIKNENVGSISALFFDGKIDKTLESKDQKNKLIKEDHIVLVKEPSSSYIGHITPSSGSSEDILKSILAYFTKGELNNLLAVGSDGTNVNTGVNGGIIRLLEEHFQQPLQWLICLLHSNELPFRAYFKSLDGETSGPKNFTGVIGKAISSNEMNPVKKFKKISCVLANGLI